MPAGTDLSQYWDSNTAWVPLQEVPEVWAAVTSIFRDYGYRRLRAKARLKLVCNCGIMVGGVVGGVAWIARAPS